MDFTYTYSLLLIPYLYLVLGRTAGAQELHACMKRSTAVVGRQEGGQGQATSMLGALAKYHVDRGSYIRLVITVLATSNGIADAERILILRRTRIHEHTLRGFASVGQCYLFFA